MLKTESPGREIWELQPPVVLNQAGPVNGTYYPLLPATELCRVYNVAINIEDTNETLRVRAIIDGQTSNDQNIVCNHSTTYNVIKRLDAISRQWVMYAETNFNRKAFMIEGRNVEIQVGKFTAAGVGNLTAVALYGVKRIV